MAVMTAGLNLGGCDVTGQAPGGAGRGGPACRWNLTVSSRKQDGVWGGLKAQDGLKSRQDGAF